MILLIYPPSQPNYVAYYYFGEQVLVKNYHRKPHEIVVKRALMMDLMLVQHFQRELAIDLNTYQFSI